MSQHSSQLPERTRLGRAALRVEDFRSVGEFYVDVVGLELIERTDSEATLGVDGTPLFEIVADEDAEPRGPEEAGLFHTAFRVPTRESLGETLHRVETLWDLDGASDHDVSEAIYFADPEGNGIEIYHDRPRDTWPVEDDGRVRMGTGPLDLDSLREDDEWVDDVPPGTDLGHVHFEVTSLPRAREFYVDALGLRVTQEFEEMGMFLAANDYHHHVGLNTWHDRSEPKSGRGIDWVEFVVPDDAAMGDLQTRLSEADLSVDRYTDGIEVTDPDAIDIRFTAED